MERHIEPEVGVPSVMFFPHPVQFINDGAENSLYVFGGQ